MNKNLRSVIWPGILVICLLAAIAAAFLPVASPIGGSARAASNSPAVLTAGQKAAIQGAGQMLLLPPENDWIYLPVVRR